MFIDAEKLYVTYKLKGMSKPRPSRERKLELKQNMVRKGALVLGTYETKLGNKINRNGGTCQKTSPRNHLTQTF